MAGPNRIQKLSEQIRSIEECTYSLHDLLSTFIDKLYIALEEIASEINTSFDTRKFQKQKIANSKLVAFNFNWLKGRIFVVPVDDIAYPNRHSNYPQKDEIVGRIVFLYEVRSRISEPFPISGLLTSRNFNCNLLRREDQCHPGAGVDI